MLKAFLYYNSVDIIPFCVKILLTESPEVHQMYFVTIFYLLIFWIWRFMVFPKLSFFV